VKNDKTPASALDAHLRQWHEGLDRLRDQLVPAHDLQESIRKSIQPIVDARDALNKALEPIFAQQELWRQTIETVRVPKISLPDFSVVAKGVADFQKAIDESFGEAFRQLQQGLKELPARTQEALIVLGEHGWYLDPEMSLPALWDLKDALLEGNLIEAEASLIEYFDQRSAEIEEAIVLKFPNRSRPIRAAFGAHKRAEYELSIPVLLAQTDGICKETIEQYLFMKRDKKPGTAIYVAQVAADTYRAALLSPLARSLPISASERERPDGFAALNRHTVLHGESVDYGTKVNSLKAISLINYVAYVLPIEND
jgi:hypothetical protein